MTRLKPCPFCGASGIQLKYLPGGEIMCMHCECKGPLPGLISDQRGREEDGRKAWNERATVDKIEHLQGSQVDKTPDLQGDDALGLALEFHRTYELLAPHYGYKTQIATRVFDPDSPNGKLMIAVCETILARRNHAKGKP